MVRPTVSDTSERWYARLPAFYREADAEQHVDDPEHYPLLRYLSASGDVAARLETLVDRADYVPAWSSDPASTSELVSADLADAAWLPWLAQLVGVQLAPALTEAERRDAIRYAPNGWRSGTKEAVADAAKTVLTGTKYARVYDHATTRADAGTASTWDVVIVTRPSETPDPALVLETVRAKRAKPAGVVLHHDEYAAAWSTLATHRPTWADWHAAPSWRDLEETMP